MKRAAIAVLSLPSDPAPAALKPGTVKVCPALRAWTPVVKDGENMGFANVKPLSAPKLKLVAVVPEPVCAVPITSRPARMGGMASRWIGVGAS